MAETIDHFSNSSPLDMFKYLPVALILSLAAVAHHDSSDSQDIKKNQVCLFDKANFQGNCKCFKASTKADLIDTKWHMNVQSIKFGSDIAEMKLFKQSNYQTPLTDLTHDVSQMDASNCDFTSFFIIRKVPAGKVCIYDDECYLGERKCFKAGAVSKLKKRWDDKIRSIQIGAGISCVDLFQDKKCKTFLQTITQSNDCLAPGISSFNVRV